VTDGDARNWIKTTKEGKDWAGNIGFKDDFTFMPEKECSVTDARPNLFFEAIKDNQTITNSPLDIYALIDATANIKSYDLDYGKGDKPTEWKSLVKGITQPVPTPGQIFRWDLSPLESGVYTLRIYLHSTEDGRYAEKQIHINISVPTSTPLPLPSLTPTPTIPVIPTVPSTPTVTETSVPTDTQTPLPTQTTTPTLSPSITPSSP